MLVGAITGKIPVAQYQIKLTVAVQVAGIHGYPFLEWRIYWQ